MKDQSLASFSMQYVPGCSRKHGQRLCSRFIHQHSFRRGFSIKLRAEADRRCRNARINARHLWCSHPRAFECCSARPVSVQAGWERAYVQVTKGRWCAGHIASWGRNDQYRHCPSERGRWIWRQLGISQVTLLPRYRSKDTPINRHPPLGPHLHFSYTRRPPTRRSHQLEHAMPRYVPSGQERLRACVRRAERDP
ncbi:hypothetical protein BOTBODRAFT_266663 [Botryobasidium botryosum FD-172 SS1]|uniref:Uncharacterized protein n=1 Tax=Botryobasidium botryosum (strain FD-172 SS1) TaxID=930990 RepID=A0A067MVY5_BOTB1|nr:hypothetical protein BOTBODRAFT_266663 [Botryobasidium botryosum FD-172 SS1]